MAERTASRASRWLLDGDGQGSGPAVAWLFLRGLALIHAVAFASLAVQVRGLIGARGLLPWAPFARALNQAHVPLFDAPSLLRWAPGDAALVGLAWLGVALAVAALLGPRPRLSLGINLALYLSFVTAGRTFFSFQWDALLIEATVLALFLPTTRRARWIHLLFRVLLFKLYFESGLAKLLGGTQWLSGQAMSLYDQTAPIPTRLAWYSHHLPFAWHRLESWATLALELGVPLLIFGPRRARRVALGCFTLFQAVDLLTANYGFFCYLSLLLGLFLLDDRDLAIAPAPAPRRRWETPWVLAPLVGCYLGLSLLAGMRAFDPAAMPRWARAVAARAAPFWAVNAFHLFGTITPERVEPRVQTLDAGAWHTQPLRFEPGPPARAPPFVAPHQPRLDFQMWFYGLAARGRPPQYVVNLMTRLCADPDAVQHFFPAPLPAHAEAVRVRFARYTFSSAAERRETGRWWHVEDLGVGPQLDCARARGR